ncbi:MAG: Crp/Fnr family transcriptional regulator, partial [Actinomycetota bacterium]|nr:Crp/Fnr family transcriptional regulator [Actinomycetota bacterium]
MPADDLSAVHANAEPGEFVSLLRPQEWRDLSAAGRSRSFLRSSYLLVEGSRSNAVFVVLSGRTKVCSTTRDGAQVLLAVRGPGALLGELAAIDDEPRTASVIALEPVKALAVPSAAFSDFLAAQPRVALMLLRALTGRLREADRKRVEFGGFDTIGRVALRLVELTERFGQAEPGGIKITIPMTQDELAGWVGASREAVVKALQSLRRRGWIDTQRRAVLV